ncbi:endochitinase-like [Sabethes cyaneus]|uniref:endochitinase-like n=1 Tax=Sabethes cyaneus TaxID=53552 RepID=UPI00237D4C26|nr:endochitinase-like [Sabethes cyaneus]
MLQNNFLIPLLIFLLANTEAIEKGNALTVCFFSNWAIYRPGIGRYSLDDIPNGLCSHVLYSFVGFSDKSPHKITEMNPKDDTDPNGLRRFSELRTRVEGAKLLVSIGGWGQDGSQFSKAASNPVSRQQFTESVVSLLNAFELDGFNIHWLWPGHSSRGGTSQDKTNFALLLKDLSDAFERDGHGRELTVTAPVEEFRLNEGYRVADICRQVDYIYLTTYDLRGMWNNFTDVHAPLETRSFDSNAFKHFNVKDGVSSWINKGCPPGKLVLGIASTGRTYTLQNTLINGLGAPSKGAGEMGEYTKSEGYVSYYEICKRIQDGWIVRRDVNGMVPYISHNDQWIGYDDVLSLKEKVKLVRQRELAGTMIYALDMDDFRGICGQQYPITKFIAGEMRKIPSAGEYEIVFGIDREGY